MKFKINDIVTTEFGVGKIVYVDNSELPYLVHIDGFDGHNGNLAGPAIQDNYNNWWFFEECLELVKRNDNKYEVGDLVRVFGKGKVRRIVEISQVFGYRLEGDINFYIDEELEPVTHLTTKEFIKEVEKLGYEVKDKDGYIDIGRDFVYVNTNVMNSIDTDTTGFQNEEVPNDLFKVCVLYANTPLELREEKEKLYTLELPNTGNENRYFQYHNEDIKEYKFSFKHSGWIWKCMFTQEEIDDLPNQELIKTLKKEPVK